MSLVQHIAMLPSPTVVMKSLRVFGVRGTAVTSQRLAALAALVNAFAMHPALLIMSPLLSEWLYRCLQLLGACERFVLCSERFSTTVCWQ